jgi:hypothetical protein
MICHDLSHTRQENRMTQFMFCCSRITPPQKTPKFWMPVISASLKKITAHLPQSRDFSCYVSRPVLTRPPPRLQNHAHTISRTLPACNIILVSANVTFASSWELWGINPVIYSENNASVDSAGDRTLAIPELNVTCLQFFIPVCLSVRLASSPQLFEPEVWTELKGDPGIYVINVTNEVFLRGGWVRRSLPVVFVQFNS